MLTGTWTFGVVSCGAMRRVSVQHLIGNFIAGAGITKGKLVLTKKFVAEVTSRK